MSTSSAFCDSANKPVNTFFFLRSAPKLLYERNFFSFQKHFWTSPHLLCISPPDPIKTRSVSLVRWKVFQLTTPDANLIAFKRFNHSCIRQWKKLDDRLVGWEKRNEETPLALNLQDSKVKLCDVPRLKSFYIPEKAQSFREWLIAPTFSEFLHRKSLKASSAIFLENSSQCKLLGFENSKLVLISHGKHYD